jgi:hypothetical protein
MHRRKQHLSLALLAIEMDHGHNGLMQREPTYLRMEKSFWKRRAKTCSKNALSETPIWAAIFGAAAFAPDGGA